MKLTLRKSDWLENWYVIERAEHDNREWLEPVCGGLALMKSSRIGNADIEGTGEEMLAIADAIEARESVSFRRCAARRSNNGYWLSSPRNSIEPTQISYEDAIGLAKVIRQVLKPRESG